MARWIAPGGQLRARGCARACVLALIGVLVAACSGASQTSIATTTPSSVASTTEPSVVTTPIPAPMLPPGLVLHPSDPSIGVPLGYVEYVPPGEAPAPRPLLVFLHGSGESGPGTAESLNTLFDAAIPKLIRYGGWPAERPFIVLAPQHLETENAPCFTADEIEAFLIRAAKEYPIDPKRIYLTGLSCGAIGAWDYLGQHTNEQVAAAVLIAGDGRDAFEFAGCALAVVPIWAFHGDQDGNVEYTGSVDPITALQACTNPAAADAELTIYKGATHNVWDRTYTLSAGDVYAWLLSHSKT